MMEAEYPQGLACCFCFSTKKSSYAKKSKSINGVLGSDHTEWPKNDEILSDLSTFSVKEQERRLKKALEEEEKVSKEAEKMVKWVKQESARIDDSAIEAILSDDEDKEKPTK